MCLLFCYMNNATKNMHVYILYEYVFSFLLDIDLGIEWWAMTLCLYFWWLIFDEIPSCFPKWLHHFTTHQQCFSVPNPSHTCQHLLVFFLVIDIQVGVSVVSHCVFDLHFLINEWLWASFHVFFHRLYIFCLFNFPLFLTGLFVSTLSYQSS